DDFFLALKHRLVLWKEVHGHHAVAWKLFKELWQRIAQCNKVLFGAQHPADHHRAGVRQGENHMLEFALALGNVVRNELELMDESLDEREHRTQLGCNHTAVAQIDA